MSTASETIDESAQASAPKPGLVLRLKRLVVAPLLLLRRLRKPRQAEVAEEDDAPPARGRKTEAEQTEAALAGPPLWRRALPYALVLLAGAAAGGGGIYWLSARIIAHQSAKLSEQAEEVARLKGLLAGYDRLTLQQKKKFDEEQGRRAALQNRLALAQADLARRPASAATAHDADPAAGGSHLPGKGSECTLRPGSIGSTLRGCLKEFNR